MAIATIIHIDRCASRMTDGTPTPVLWAFVPSAAPQRVAPQGLQRVHTVRRGLRTGHQQGSPDPYQQPHPVHPIRPAHLLGDRGVGRWTRRRDPAQRDQGCRFRAYRPVRRARPGGLQRPARQGHPDAGRRLGRARRAHCPWLEPADRDERFCRQPCPAPPTPRKTPPCLRAPTLPPRSPWPSPSP